MKFFTPDEYQQKQNKGSNSSSLKFFTPDEYSKKSEPIKAPPKIIVQNLPTFNKYNFAETPDANKEIKKLTKSTDEILKPKQEPFRTTPAPVQASPVSSGTLRMPTTGEKARSFMAPYESFANKFNEAVGVNRVLDYFTPEKNKAGEEVYGKSLEERYPKQGDVGSVAGNVATYTGGAKVASALSKGLNLGSRAAAVTNYVVPNVVSGGLEGIGKKESPADIAKRIAMYTTLDVGASKLFPAVSKSVKGLISPAPIESRVPGTGLKFNPTEAPRPKLETRLPESNLTTFNGESGIKLQPIKETPLNANAINSLSLNEDLLKNMPKEASDMITGLDKAGQLNKKTLSALNDDLEKQINKIESDTESYIRNYKGKGVDQGNISFDNQGNLLKRVGRVSNNDDWYRQFYKENGFAPRVKDANDLTKKILSEGYANVSPDEDYLKLLEIKKSIERFGKLDLELFSEAQKKLALTRQQNKEAKLLSDRSTLNNQYQTATDIPDTTSQIVEANKKEPTTIKQKLSNAYTSLVDRFHPIKKVDDATHRMANISTNAYGTSDYILKESLVNKAGEEVGESFSTIFKRLPNKKMTTPSGKVVDAETALNDYMLHQHNRSSNSVIDDVLKNDAVTNSTVNKRIFKEDITPEMSDRIIKDYEAINPELKEVAASLRKSYDTFMQEWAVNGDLVSQNLYDTIKNTHPDYVPKNRYFTELEKLNPKVNPSSGFVGNKKVVNKFEGSSRDIINPISSLISNQQRIILAVRGNEVGLELLKSIRNNTLKKPNIAEILPTTQSFLDEINGIIDEHGVEGLTDYIGAQFDKAVSKNLKGSNIVTVMEKGSPVQIKINDIDLLKSLRGITESTQGTVEKIGRRITAPFKATITGLNPIFAVKNITRDIPTAYINSITNNPAKFGVDLVIAAKEMASNGKYWKEYKALGGEHGNFFNDGGNKLTNAKNIIVKGDGVLSKAGGLYKDAISSTESVNRFAEYMRTVKAGGNTYESKLMGLANAQEVSTNFGRHGNVTKAIDSWVPYLNPAVQGLDKTARQFIKKPVETTLKSIAAISVPTLIMNYINKDDPNYEALDNRTKDINFLIPREDGTFTKIPKNRDTGAIFGAMIERIIRMIKGDSEAFKNFDETLRTNLTPPNPFTSNIASPIVTNLPSNKDFAGRSIEPLYMQDRNKRDRYNDKTSNIAKSVAPIAEKLGLSPMQVDYLIRSYTGIVGQVGLPATTEDADWGKVIGGGFKADPLYNNQSVQDFYENKDKLKLDAGSKNFNEGIASKIVTPEERLRNVFDKSSSKISAITKKINVTKNPEEIKLLRKQIIDIAKINNDRLKSIKNK